MRWSRAESVPGQQSGQPDRPAILSRSGDRRVAKADTTGLRSSGEDVSDEGSRATVGDGTRPGARVPVVRGTGRPIATTGSQSTQALEMGRCGACSPCPCSGWCTLFQASATVAPADATLDPATGKRPLRGFSRDFARWFGLAFTSRTAGETTLWLCALDSLCPSASRERMVRDIRSGRPTAASSAFSPGKCE